MSKLFVLTASSSAFAGSYEPHPTPFSDPNVASIAAHAEIQVFRMLRQGDCSSKDSLGNIAHGASESRKLFQNCGL